MWLSDLKIVLPDRVIELGSIQIEGGIIAQVIEGSAPVDVPSLQGLTVIPGIIDLHGDMLERDVLPRPNARFPTELGLIELDKRLAGAGITTAFAAISFAWKEDDIRSQEDATEMIQTINKVRDHLLVDMQVHARFEVTNPKTSVILAEFLEQGQVQLVSIMDHSPGQGQYGDVERYLDFMRKWMGVDIDSLGEFKDRVIEQLKQKAANAVQIPRDWDVVKDVLDVAKKYSIPVASHDDDTAQKVEEQAQLGVTISEFPVTQIAAKTARDLGMHVVMGAPNAYRGRSTSNNLSAMDAIRGGWADILATDYYPAAMFHTAFKLAHENIMSLPESIALITCNAADAVGLHDRGRIEEGKLADLVIIEEHDYSRVRCTIRQGIPIFLDGFMADQFRVRDTLRQFNL